MADASNLSFMSIYKPEFDQEQNEWILQVLTSSVIRRSDIYEVHLPVYSSRALAIGGNVLRPLRKKYRAWLLNEQGGVCAICGKGAQAGNRWNLDHQPPLADLSKSRFIDYYRITQNRVIHEKCDIAQLPKETQ
jgi:hypothetical protein